MPLYPLGISRRRDVPSVPKQAAGTVDVRWSLVGELACAFIDAPHQAVPPMLHATVLDAIHRRVCVVPVRFGLALGEEAEIHALLQARHDELLDHLSRLGGTCEMGVQIAALDTSKTAAAVAPDHQSPLAYLDRRRSYYQRVDDDEEQDRAIVQRFVERLHGYFRQWRKLPASPSRRIRLAFLVERDRVMAFQSGVENARKSCQEGRCRVLGPWPPYSFVEAISEHLHANVGGR
jgi:hypothetical protein